MYFILKAARLNKVLTVYKRIRSDFSLAVVFIGFISSVEIFTVLTGGFLSV